MIGPQFTPGPWRVVPPPSTNDPRLLICAEYNEEERKRFVAESIGKWIAEVRPYNRNELLPNARLIAAAPDMFSALSVAAANLCLVGPDHDGMDSPSCGDEWCVGCVARAALKKAAP